MESPNTETEKGEKQKSRACSSFSLTSGGLFTKNLSSLTKQSIPHTTMMFYGDCVKMCENFSGKRTCCCTTTMPRLTLPFSPDNFLPEAT
jgi:hypothetical protein